VASEAFTGLHARRLARSESLELVVPDCEAGIGDVIAAPDAARLIDGVRIQPLAIWPDDRGYFLEVQRFGRGLAAGFPAASTQVSAALNYPAAIKAFHYHLRQTDCWAPVAGMFQVALIDLRAGSPTLAAKNTIYVGTLRPWQILIPPGIAHGYKVIGPEPGILVYMTDRFYDPNDEGRIAYNDPQLAYDWELQHK
jgi:dTDP-4-dehydrorhamnose 3,5-epimerase